MNRLLENNGTADLAELGEALVGGASEGILIANRSGTIVYANPAAHEMFRSTEDLKGSAVDSLIPNPQRQHHNELRSAYHQAPSRRSMGQGRELHALRRDGSVLPVEISLTPLTLDGEALTAAMVIDISERKALENQVLRLNKLLEQQVLDRTRELNRSQLLYRTVARNYPNGTIFVLDEALRYEFAEGKELFEWNLTSEDLKGNLYLDQLPADLREEVGQRLQAVLAGSNQSFEVQHHGSTYRLDAVSVQIEAEESPRILVVEQNITEEKKALDKERQLNELKSRFVSMASHEFRTPLSTISSSADLARQHTERGNRERVEVHLEKIKGAVNHLVSILDDYLSLERFQTRDWDANREPLSVRETVGATLEKQRSMLRRGQHLHADLHSDLSDFTEMSHKEAVQGIVSNLVSNASKYSDEGAHIEVTLQLRDGTHWHLAVRDHGVGIAEADQTAIFTRFFRCDQTSHIPGTGVGLDLVQQYTSFLDGNITLDSSPGKGSTFTVTWPKGEATTK